MPRPATNIITPTNALIIFKLSYVFVLLNNKLMLKEIKYIMIHFLRNLQLLFASSILIATSIGFVLEIVQMINLRTVSLPDLLLLFIYLEVIGMVTSYWRTQTIRLTYPLFIAITALSRLIILQQKDSIDPSALIYESGAVLLLAIAIVILKFRRSKHLGIKLDKEEL
jgi:protein PsiE